MPEPSGLIEQALAQAAPQLVFLTPGERAGRWRDAFGDAADRVPHPYWLYSGADQSPLVLGFPLRLSASWDAFGREIARLVEAEIAYRRAMAQQAEVSKAALVDQRRLVVGKIAETLENAYLHDYGQRLPEVFLLVLTREVAEHLRVATRALVAAAPELGARAVDEIRYATAHRFGDVVHRARAQALERLRRVEALEPTPASRAFAELVRDDLVPFAERHVSTGLPEVTAYVQGHLHIDAGRFRTIFRATTDRIQELRAADPAFDRVLAATDPDAAAIPGERSLFCPAVLELLEFWPHPATPHLSADLRRLLIDVARRFKRFEVIDALRERVVGITELGSHPITQLQGRTVQLSDSTRPFDFTSPGVLPSVVRRYGLLYDLVEFTQLIEELRRHGRTSEEQAMRQMVRFLAGAEEVRRRHRLKFEKFLGDGAFYSARSARAVFLAAAELRTLYERMRRHGFPFDRGLRLAVNVGTYHLLPMVPAAVDRPTFEFFGHGLVELVRLTTGKTTHEVEDIADFLIASGYDLQRVLEFLEPVRHANRFAPIMKDRPYAAFIAENGELVNLGGVVTESFLRDLEVEWEDGPLAEGEAFGVRWLLLGAAAAGEKERWIGLRVLGTARLKGLEPMPLIETVVFDEAPKLAPLAPRTPLERTLQRLSGALREDDVETTVVEVDPALCVVSVLEAPAARTWYIGRFEEELAALVNAFRITLTPVGLTDGEPFESWLFQRRADLAKLYHGLRRNSAGATVPLEDLRRRDGYLTCRLAAPHRSPR